MTFSFNCSSWHYTFYNNLSTISFLIFFLLHLSYLSAWDPTEGGCGTNILILIYVYMLIQKGWVTNLKIHIYKKKIVEMGQGEHISGLPELCGGKWPVSTQSSSSYLPPLEIWHHEERRSKHLRFTVTFLSYFHLSAQHSLQLLVCSWCSINGHRKDDELSLLSEI